MIYSSFSKEYESEISVIGVKIVGVNFSESFMVASRLERNCSQKYKKEFFHMEIYLIIIFAFLTIWLLYFS